MRKNQLQAFLPRLVANTAESIAHNRLNTAKSNQTNVRLKSPKPNRAKIPFIISILANFTRILRRQPIEVFNNVIGYRKWAAILALL